MNHIYHAVPEHMVDSQLVPLNQMEASMPELFAQNRAKYKDRQALLKRKVPLLECLWNDVVQFLPLHPQKVFDLQKQLKLIPEVPPYRFYKIDVRLLDPKLAVVFRKEEAAEHVTWLTDTDFAALQDIPRPTVAYYESLVGTGELPFNYQFIPHVLYKGTLDVSQAQIVTLKDRE